jgi:hypothetical protein
MFFLIVALAAILLNSSACHCERWANKKMTEKENKKHLTWLGIELSTSIPLGGANFDPRGFISTNTVDIH